MSRCRRSLRPSRLRGRAASCSPPVLVAAGVAAAIVAGVVFVFTRGAEASSGIPANTAALLNGSGAEIEAEVPVTGRPGGIAVGAGSVWVTDTVEGTVLRIDPDEHLVVDRVEVGRGPEGVAVGDGCPGWRTARKAPRLRVQPGRKRH